MDEGALQFIEKMGLLFESQGVSRSAGRIAGWLLVSEKPQTLNDLAEGLQISKGSVSTNTRVLENIGMIEKVSLRGERKVYYQLAIDVWLTMLRQSLSKVQAFVELAREGQELVSKDNTVAQERLAEMEQMFLFLQQKAVDWLRELEQQRKQ